MSTKPLVILLSLTVLLGQISGISMMVDDCILVETADTESEQEDRTNERGSEEKELEDKEFSLLDANDGQISTFASKRSSLAAIFQMIHCKEVITPPPEAAFFKS